MMFYSLVFPHALLNCQMNEKLLEGFKNLFCDLDGSVGEDTEFSVIRSQYRTFQIEQDKGQPCSV